MIAQLVIATGWTYDYIRHNMTFKRYKNLVDVWKITPPMAHLMSAWVGYKPQEEVEKTQQEKEEEQYRNLIADFSAAGGKTN